MRFLEFATKYLNKRVSSYKDLNDYDLERIREYVSKNYSEEIAEELLELSKKGNGWMSYVIVDLDSGDIELTAPIFKTSNKKLDIYENEVAFCLVANEELLYNYLYDYDVDERSDDIDVDDEGFIYDVSDMIVRLPEDFLYIVNI